MSATADDIRVVRLSRSAFSLDAVKRASYTLMARIDTSLEVSDEEIVCTLMPASGTEGWDDAERDFRREVVDQDLRISIEQRTEAYRDTILGLAFSRTGLQNG